ncbi:hypothetical protein NQ314_002717 [Rhamnusium bicolor]|uniref:Uncharacterized protein n=1 Tax=Rhamnusium bicolor TaxID=1586634 RepID=A0AAV8ZS55_9CUCU|nr:hypothetical protein NQ314_002717 [Rhamnusium bicolor]
MVHPSRKEIFTMSVTIGICLVKKKKRRKIWCKKWLMEKDKFSHISLIKELQISAPDDFFNYLRMNTDTFYALLEIIRPDIEKQDTRLRKAISAEDRLAALRFLATVTQTLNSTIISPQSLSEIILETCGLFTGN